MGSAELYGLEPTPAFFMWHSDSTHPPDANRLTIEIFDVPTVEGRRADVWARDMFAAIAQALPLTYAKAHMNQEFAAKNMHQGEDGTWAIGVQLLDYLPGLYWLNYFGPPYCDLIGRDRILTAPAYEVWPSGDGVIVSLAESAEEWETPAYQRREQAVIEHLGKPYFFSRDDPKRESLAPDFDAIRKRDGGQ
jgi:hypothetical protein